MEYEEILAGKRPINNTDVQSLKDSIQRSPDVDEKLFSDVLSNMIANRHSDIYRVEDDPTIRDALQARENDENQKNALIDVKLTPSQKRDRFYPSAITTTVPKFYSNEELQQQLDRITVLLQTDMDNIFRTPDFDLNSQEILDSNPNLEIVAAAAEEEQKLSDQNIEIILGTMDYSKFYVGDRPNVVIDPNVARAAEKDRRREMENQLRRIKIKPHRVPKYVEMYEQRFFQSLAIPGKYVGNIMASSYGEAATQQTLNTFHFAGDRNARKQLNGLPKFMNIVEVSENPDSPTITIFTKVNYTEEQLRMKIPIFQMTTLEQIIESYRILGDDNGLPPSPRWEQVSDIVRGVPIEFVNSTVSGFSGRVRIPRYSTTPNIDPPRLNTHRGHPAFLTDPVTGKTKGRILEIKFDVKELFFRRITLGQIAEAIEEENSLVRVVSSSLDIGLIYVYYPFKGLTQESLIGKGQIPSFAEADPFSIFLRQAYFPKIKELQIGGIYGIDYVSVQSYSISKAIDKQNSTMASKIDANGNQIANFNPKKRLSLHFTQSECDRWGLDEFTLLTFVMARLSRFVSADFQFEMQYKNDDGYVVEFNTLGLFKKNNNGDAKIQMSKDDIIAELDGVVKIPIYDLVKAPAPGILDDRLNPSAVKFSSSSSSSSSSSTITTTTTTSSGTLIIHMDAHRLAHLGFDIEQLASTIAAVIESDINDNPSQQKDKRNRQPKREYVKLDVAADLPTSKIIIKGIPLQIYLNLDEGVEYVENKLKETMAVSETIQNASTKWFYEAEGNNLVAILSHPEVNSRYTRSDNGVEVFRTLGVEAYRSIILFEIAANVKEGINPAHIELLADSLSSKTPGDKPLAQNRNGLAKRGAEFIARSFETTTESFMKAGLGQIDNLASFPSQVMLGTLGRNGGLGEEARKRIFRSTTFKNDFPRRSREPRIPESRQIEGPQSDQQNETDQQQIERQEIVPAATIKEAPILPKQLVKQPVRDNKPAAKPAARKPLSQKEKMARASLIKQKGK